MAKRIMSGILGAIVLFGSLLPLGNAFEIFKDFENPDLPFWPNVLGTFAMGAIAVAGLSIGIYFLRFASSGHESPNHSWTKPVLLGVGSFFPGFVFSLPLTIVWIERRWPGDDTKLDLTLEASACIGIVVAIICTIVLLRKRVLSRVTPPPD